MKVKKEKIERYVDKRVIMFLASNAKMRAPLVSTARLRTRGAVINHLRPILMIFTHIYLRKATIVAFAHVCV